MAFGTLRVVLSARFLPAMVFFSLLVPPALVYVDIIGGASGTPASMLANTSPPGPFAEVWAVSHNTIATNSQGIIWSFTLGVTGLNQHKMVSRRKNL
jgi:hypothetical protein